MRQLSLKLKITLIPALAVSIIFVSNALINIRVARRLVEEELKKRAVDSAHSLIDYLQQFDRIKPSVALDLFVSNLLREQKDLVKAEVLASAGGDLQPIAAMSRLDLPADPRLYRAALGQQVLTTHIITRGEERYWLAVAPLFLRGKLAGLALTYVSLREADLLIRRQLVLFLSTAAAAIVLLTLILSLYLNRAINNPIRQLVAAMERVKGGDLKSRVDVRRRDEIGKLAEHFNAMVAKICEENQRNLELMARTENFNQELRARIAEATRELSERNRELKQLTEDLLEMRGEIARLETLASLGELSATIAHEVGTPLHSISGLVQLMLERRELPADLVEKLTIIQSQVDRLAATISSIMSATRLPAPELRELDLGPLLRDIVNLTSPGLRRRNIELALDLEREAPPVYADQNQLQQVFLNLINNAAEAMPEGGTLRVSTRTEFNNGRPYVSITFADTGSGIAAENINKIFNPFFSTKIGRKAAGLGLSICKKIVRDHRGEIEVQSDPGRGAQFTVKLPARPPENSLGARG